MKTIKRLCYFPFAVAIILSRFCLRHVLPYFIKRNKRPTSHILLKKQLLHKEVSIQRLRKSCYGREIHRSKAYLVTLAEIQDTSAVFYPLIWLANIKTKGFTSLKSFCRSGSQTLFFRGREATTGNASAVRRLCSPQPLPPKINVVFWPWTKVFLLLQTSLIRKHPF